jgi:hypothetical protein
VSLDAAVHVPAHIEHAVDDAVAGHLEAELGNRGLLLTADRLATAAAETAEWGSRLLARVVDHCYRVDAQEDVALAIEFESEAAAARIQTALAFGAVTVPILVRGQRDPRRPAASIELVCAMFNLGIGLVDGLCDDDPESGGALLELVREHDLAGAAEESRRRGWLRAALPAALEGDPTVEFTVQIIEAFFETLHASYPEEAKLRHGVGAQLCAALEAERQSVVGPPDGAGRDQLIECSRLTSVLPFQILESLAGGDPALNEPRVGTQLGEAMWRIDDLVDLCDDARSGSLNAILLWAAPGAGRPGERDLLTALERLPASAAIAGAAAEAAEKLLAGLRPTGGPDDHPSFLHFVQRYAGISPLDVRTRQRA